MTIVKKLSLISIALNISEERQGIIVEKERQHFEALHPDFMLVNAHTRFAN